MYVLNIFYKYEDLVCNEIVYVYYFFLRMMFVGLVVIFKGFRVWGCFGICMVIWIYFEDGYWRGFELVCDYIFRFFLLDL